MAAPAAHDKSAHTILLQTRRTPHPPATRSTAYRKEPRRHRQLRVRDPDVFLLLPATPLLIAMRAFYEPSLSFTPHLIRAELSSAVADPQATKQNPVGISNSGLGSPGRRVIQSSDIIR